MIFEDVLESLEDLDAKICESFKAWCDYYGVNDEELFAIDYSTGLWR